MLSICSLYVSTTISIRLYYDLYTSLEWPLYVSTTISIRLYYDLFTSLLRSLCTCSTSSGRWRASVASAATRSMPVQRPTKHPAVVTPTASWPGSIWQVKKYIFGFFFVKYLGNFSFGSSFGLQQLPIVVFVSPVWPDWTFFKIDCIKFSPKISPNVWRLFRIFENTTFQKTFWATFGNNWALFISTFGHIFCHCDSNPRRLDGPLKMEDWYNPHLLLFP